MDKVERGKKYICIACMSKFYGLNKDIVICPKCGKEQTIEKTISQKVENTLNVGNKEKIVEDNNLEEEVSFDDVDKDITSESS